MISHYILSILPPNCTKCVCSFPTTKKLSIDVETSAKRRKYKIEKRDDHGKSSNIMEKSLKNILLKPIFHQNAKYLGTFASPNAKDSTFASPNARNTNMLVSLALGDASFLRWPCTFLFFCVDFFALGSKRKPNSQWNIGCVGCLALGLCVRHVHFMR